MPCGSCGLGAPIGGQTAINAAMDASLTKAAKTRKNIELINNAPTEMVLASLCADVANVQYNLRLNGDTINTHDRSLRMA